ncbi:MAG: endonuclease [Planctomycetaceae bacterium]|nr:endonuclease [Planctomycetaceae bacterium]
MSITLRNSSRSIVANRLNRFATLYDPESPPDEPRENPTVRRIDDGQAISLPLELVGAQYRQFRKKLLKQDPHCAFCGCEVDMSSSSLDHLTAQSRGGKDWPANLVLACHECNHAKGSLTLAEWCADEMAEVAKRQQRINGMLALIEARGECYVATGSRDQPAAEVPAELAPVAETALSTETPVESNQWRPEQFEKGRRDYWILSKDDRQPILRHLRLNEAVHVLEHIRGDGLELVFVTPMYNDDLGISRTLHAEASPEFSAVEVVL